MGGTPQEVTGIAANDRVIEQTLWGLAVKIVEGGVSESKGE